MSIYNYIFNYFIHTQAHSVICDIDFRAREAFQFVFKSQSNRWKDIE